MSTAPTSPAYLLAATATALALAVAGCGIIPADTEGTLDRARGGTLVVGVSEHPPWTVLDAGQVRGSEAALITGFAAEIDADIQWRPGPESALAAQIGEGELDLVIGGLRADSPWSEEMALTRPYAEDLVIGVRMGENELLIEVERYLAREHGDIS